MRTAGRKVIVLPKLPVAQGINAARTIFANCYFDRERCADGLTCLRRYRYEIDEDTGKWSQKPLHDQYSHGADAFRNLAMIADQMTNSDQRPPVDISIYLPSGGIGIG